MAPFFLSLSGGKIKKTGRFRWASRAEDGVQSCGKVGVGRGRESELGTQELGTPGGQGRAESRRERGS